MNNSINSYINSSINSSINNNSIDNPIDKSFKEAINRYNNTIVQLRRLMPPQNQRPPAVSTNSFSPNSFSTNYSISAGAQEPSWWCKLKAFFCINIS